jgi:hypothetical protein
VQRQITSTLALEVGYVGNHGTHVFAGDGPAFNINQATLQGYPNVPLDQRRPFSRFSISPVFLSALRVLPLLTSQDKRQKITAHTHRGEV